MWKQLKNFSKYEVSTSGVVRNIKTGNNLKPRNNKPSRNNKGYYVFDLYNDAGIKKSLKRSRILAILFIDNPENFPEVDHKDGDTHNDTLNNLEWVSKSENCNRAAKKRSNSRYTTLDTEKLILQLRGEGLTYSKISEITKTPMSTVSRIINGINKSSTTIL